jgi:hypothetical protein
METTQDFQHHPTFPPHTCRKMSDASPVVDPSTFILTCCGISLAWAAIQFSIISQTK